FATPHFDDALTEGREIYDFIESNLEITPVGITPIYYNEGYLFIDEFPGSETRIFGYQLSIFQNTYETYRGLHVKHLKTIRRGLTQTYENLKLELTRENKELPNPATFA